MIQNTAISPVPDPIAHAEDRSPVPYGEAVVRTRPKARRMTLERWRTWKPTDGWKYDWDNGFASKSKKMVTKEQRYIVRNLLRVFAETPYYRAGNDLIPEAEMAYGANRYRIPDLAYFTSEQTVADAKGNTANVATFVVEIISDSDTGRAIEDKLWEYFENGVQTVWYIFPSRQLVKTYISPFECTVCIGEMVCSAAPALPDFAVSAANLFALPQV